MEDYSHKEKELRILYTNASSLLNELQELKVLLNSLKHAPQIIAITEVNNKINSKSLISECHIPGYELDSANLEKVSHGILFCVDISLQSSSINIIKSSFKEYLIVSIKGANIDNLTICALYHSPTSNSDNDNALSSYIYQLCNDYSGNILIIGDFYISYIYWSNYTSTSNNSSSITLLKAIRYNFLTQHIDTPTRARGADVLMHLIFLI